MEKQSNAIDVWIGIKVIDAGSIKGACAANNTMDFVATLQQQLGEVTAVLARDTCDQRFVHQRSLRAKAAARARSGFRPNGVVVPSRCPRRETEFRTEIDNEDEPKTRLALRRRNHDS